MKKTDTPLDWALQDSLTMFNLLESKSRYLKKNKISIYDQKKYSYFLSLPTQNNCHATKKLYFLKCEKRTCLAFVCVENFLPLSMHFHILQEEIIIHNEIFNGQIL